MGVDAAFPGLADDPRAGAPPTCLCAYAPGCVFGRAIAAALALSSNKENLFWFWWWTSTPKTPLPPTGRPGGLRMQCDMLQHVALGMVLSMVPRLISRLVSYLAPPYYLQYQLHGTLVNTTRVKNTSVMRTMVRYAWCNIFGTMSAPKYGTKCGTKAGPMLGEMVKSYLEPCLVLRLVQVPYMKSVT